MNVKQDKGFEYVEEGDGEVLVLLHGLFGALSNFADILEYFSKKYKVIIPLLPIYKLPSEEVSLEGMVKYLHEFIVFKEYDNIMLLGNSLGGHIALMYTLEHQDKVSVMVLTGSSGLYESSFGDTYPKKGDYDYIKEKTALTFYDPKVASKELIDEVFKTINDREKAFRIIAMSKSAIRSNLADQLHEITVPAMLIWGKNDTITPPDVAKEFNERLGNAQLQFIDKCGHAPMMERPKEFNNILEKFLDASAVRAEQQ